MPTSLPSASEPQTGEVWRLHLTHGPPIDHEVLDVDDEGRVRLRVKGTNAPGGWSRPDFSYLADPKWERVETALPERSRSERG